MPSVRDKSKIEFNFEGLKDLQKNLKSRRYAKVGIVKGKSANNRSGTAEINNAGLGLVHEYGSIIGNIPARSFLRLPFAEKRKEFVKKVRVIIMNEIAKKDGDRMIFDKMGAQGKAIVLLAFATRGFGKWEPLKPATIKAKGSATPLIDSGQLRQAIEYEVSDDT